MKQKMVIKVQMHCEKCRTKALTIAAATPGVNEMSIQGAEKDQLVVIGEVDSVELTCKLRKKLHGATIVSVEEKKEEAKKKKEPEKKEDKNTPICYAYCPPLICVPEMLVQEPCQPQLCSIL